MEAHKNFRGHGALQTRTDPGKPRGSMALMVPPVEEENPRVKCRDCGAFGHNWRSKRCPIKNASVFLVPQPLAGRKEKENRDPGSPQSQRTKRPSHGPGQRCDERQRKPPFQKCPMESPRKGQHIHWAHSKNLGFIPRNKKRVTPDTIEMTAPPAKKDLGRQMCPENPPTRSIVGSSFLPSRQEEGPSMAVTAMLKPVNRQEGRKAVAEDRPHHELPGSSAKHPRAGAQRNGLGQVFNKECKDQGTRTEQPRLPGRATLAPARPCTESQEPPAAHVAGQPLRMIFTRDHGEGWTSRFVKIAPHLACTESQEPPAAHVAGQPLRMIFTRDHGEGWTSRFVKIAPSLPNQKKTPPSESQASQEKGDGAHSQVPRSVLYEDLLVSSSSSSCSSCSSCSSSSEDSDED
ncbi:Fam90a1a [Phodopus roborovskii]|uniref:Fam90a1a protein n=1 Tax=Phodopus roborovskii TaxID=109678 RepID=A0AAU9Z3K3_PHORO|nr:Fam90a1a [Phodopus roborovskii]